MMIIFRIISYLIYYEIIIKKVLSIILNIFSKNNIHL